MASRVLVTGAAKRIGRGIALAFARAGYSLVVHYHTSRAEAEELCASLSDLNGLEHRCVGGDLRDPKTISALFEELSRDGQGLSVVVNNASAYCRRDLTATDLAGLHEDFAVNFEAPYEVMRCYRRYFSGGQIINLLDYRVELADPSSGGYALAKKALKDATLSAALSWAPSFRVNGLAPGLVLSPPGVPPERLKRLEGVIPTGCRTTVEEVGRSAVFLAETPCLNGQILYLDGGLHLLGADAVGERRNTGVKEQSKISRTVSGGFGEQGLRD